ncbi:MULTISPECIES: hypothetical protein [Bacillus cereus group]|uniref:Uncharacterized protein n=1 Tax=Bacillus cereus TaxID=1396 RepID=A0AA44QCR8_BACCE|nr:MULTISPECIES: hypothetical protein [Bacillus cereus group]PFN04594.1 hypothetical protein COJ55_21050 [Bacillus cereus]PFS05030.1 hypothetical protein COK38_05725 [Bacillus cereus]
MINPFGDMPFPCPILPSKSKRCSPVSPNKIGCKCDFKKSKLFCTSENGTLNIDVLPNVDFWQNVATLKVCQEDCSEVLHTVSGIISSAATSFGIPTLTTILLNNTFRIIDEFGREVCQHTFSFSQDVTAPANTTVAVDFPFCFQCCDRPRQCESNTTYRLQVSGESENLSLIRDTSWEAIVWENC